MDFELRDRNQLREILRASEGIPRQEYDEEARKKNPGVSRPVGHPLANHLHSFEIYESNERKTKFVSLDDMVAPGHVHSGRAASRGPTQHDLCSRVRGKRARGQGTPADPYVLPAPEAGGGRAAVAAREESSASMMPA
jgi:hypothetical protein